MEISELREVLGQLNLNIKVRYLCTYLVRYVYTEGMKFLVVVILQCCGSGSFFRIRIRSPGLGSGSGSRCYSHEYNKINWKGELNKEYLPYVWVLLGLLTRKMK
jgi:hypothetical protein